MINKLMDRINKLEYWQQHQIIFSLLFYLNHEMERGSQNSATQMRSVISEIEDYEKINKEDN